MTPFPPTDPAAAPEASAPLRARLRAARRALDRRQRVRAAVAVRRAVARLRWLRPGACVALYAAIDGEVDPALLLDLARARGCRVFLPRITDFRRRRMHFLPALGARSVNRYGVDEPVPGEGRGASRLQLIFVPLVAFDRRGGRLGMGSGFYDRALSFRRLRRRWNGPRIVGLAYAFQETAGIATRAHDIRLDAVVTDRAVFVFRGIDR